MLRFNIGSRQATVVVPPGTSATLVMPDGSLLMAAYGKERKSDAFECVGVFASRDRGETWSHLGSIRALHEMSEAGLARLSDGTRRVLSVSEVVGMEGETVAMQDIFVFRKKGISPEGAVLGQYQATGIRPKFADRLAVNGIAVSAELFREGHVI